MHADKALTKVGEASSELKIGKVQTRIFLKHLQGRAPLEHHIFLPFAQFPSISPLNK